MKKNCGFTICAKNYLGLAKVLKKSFLQNSSEDFYIFIADEIENELLAEDILRCRSVLNIKKLEWIQNSFKYDVTEFCTYLKPFCFDFLFNNYENVCYFDPDLMFFSETEVIYREFENHDFLVTPHLLELREKQAGYHVIEDELRVNGQNNFGFVGVRNSENGRKFIHWWEDRLANKCYRDAVSGQFTDQGWGNFLFSYFSLDSIKVFRDKGMNLAPWNFDERKVLLKDGKYYVASRLNEKSEIEKLVFVHYSGFNYVKLLNNEIEQGNDGHEVFYEDLKPLFEEYKKFLKENSDIICEYIKNGYAYNFFSNGNPISLLNRRLYRAILLHKDDYEDIGNPFDSNNPKFYKILEKKKLLDKSVTRGSGKIQDLPENYIKKYKLLCSLFFIFRKIIGHETYMNLMNVLHCMGIPENQFFLFDDSKIWLWWRRERIGKKGK